MRLVCGVAGCAGYRAVPPPHSHKHDNTRRPLPHPIDPQPHEVHCGTHLPTFSRGRMRCVPIPGAVCCSLLCSHPWTLLRLSRGLLGRGASKPHIHTLWRTTSAPGIGHQSGPRQRVNFPSAARAPMCAPIGNRSSWCDVPASACFRAALACSRAGSSRAAARHLLLVCAKSTFGPHKSRSNTRTYSLTSHSMRRKSRGGGEAKPLNAGQGRATTRQVQ